MDKRGFQLAISTIILLVLGIVVLIGLTVFLINNFDRFSDVVDGFFGDDEQAAADLCETECGLDRSYDFCCSTKLVNKIEKTCLDLEIDCDNINCAEVTC